MARLPELTPTRKRALAVALAAVTAAVAAFTDLPAGVVTAVNLLVSIFGG